MKPLLITLSGCLFTAMLAGATPETNAPVLGIYHTPSISHNPSVPFRNVAVVALWGDGRIVWSTASPVVGGAPYRTARFDPAKLQSLLDRLERDSVLGDKALMRPNYGPDSSYTTLLVDDGKRYLRMQSWHQIAERHTNVVATANGLQSLNGQDRDKVLQNQPADYRRYRQVWGDIRKAALDLIPEKGEPFTGTVPIPNLHSDPKR